MTGTNLGPMLYIAPLFLLVALVGWLVAIYWAEARPEYKNHAARSTAGAAQLVVRSVAAEPDEPAGMAGVADGQAEDREHDETTEHVPVG